VQHPPHYPSHNVHVCYSNVGYVSPTGQNVNPGLCPFSDEPQVATFATVRLNERQIQEEAKQDDDKEDVCTQLLELDNNKLLQITYNQKSFEELQSEL